jgi:competence protein ComEC
MSRVGWLLALWPGVVLGVALQLQQARLWPLAVYALAGLGGVVLTGWLWRRWRLGRGWRWLAGVLAAALIGLGYTGWRAHGVAALAMPPALQGVDLTLTGVVASLPQRGADGLRFVFEVADNRPAGVPPRLQLGWYWHGAAPEDRHLPRAGEHWRLTVRLRSPHGPRNPHGFDRERWLWEHGIAATGYVRLGPRDPPPQRLQPAGPGLDAARQAVSEAIGTRVTEPRRAGVLAALVVGDQSAIERADWDLFRTTGVAHLMSISGLHITLFAWLATRLIGLLWRRLARWHPALLLAVPQPLAAGVGGVVLATAYALFSGWGVPAQRTVLMLALVVGLRLLGRHWPWLPLWGLAMVAVLLLDPWALLQPGFWLSFVAVGILFASDPAGREPRPAAAPRVPRVRRGLNMVWGLWREQGVMTVALAPLSLLLFGQLSVVGLVANLLAIPWVTLLITPLAFAGVVLPPLWDLAAWALQVLLAWLGWLAQVGWAAVFRPIPPLPLALLAVCGGVLLVLKLPWVLRSAGGLLIVPALLWQPPRPAAGAFEVMAIDVGQGSAVLLRTARHSLLYDAGPRYGPGSDAGQRIVLPLLRALGEVPDAVVISHRDSDHAGGADAVRAAWPRARWLSSFDADPARRCVAGQRWTWDGVHFEMLHPTPEHYAPDGSARLPSNAMSCVLRVDNGQQSAWLSGDLDAERETRLALARPDLRADLLLAPHHGSATSSSPVLLNTLRPSVVLIQSGYRNRFGHPAPVVLQRYRERGLLWVNSPQCGASRWRSEAPGAVHCERAQHRRYWHHIGADAGAPEPSAPDTEAPEAPAPADAAAR